MKLPIDTPVVCPVTVGRSAYLEALQRVVDGVERGEEQIVLIAGEAGIGKSRLVAETKAHAALRGHIVLQGRCYEPDHSLPYAPMVDLLQRLPGAQLAQQASAHLGPLAGELTRLLPELAPKLETVPEPAVEAEVAKRRLFQILAQYFVSVGEGRPLLLILEDLHWSDDSSLEFLLYLARRIGPHPILLLATYRSDEAHVGLVHCLASLDRERLASELRPAPLSRADTDVMLGAILGLGRPIPPRLLDAVHTLTEGNPFFIEEVLRSLTTGHDTLSALPREPGRWPVPRSLQDAVQRRTGRLSPAGRRIVQLAAVAGRRFDLALLQALATIDERQLLEAVTELVGAQLVVQASADQFAFRHTLTQEAVYGELLAPERRTLHRRVGEMMERLYPEATDRQLADLADHFYWGGVWDKALQYAQRLGDRAQALYTPRAAAACFTRALEAAGRLGLAPPVRLYHARGQAYEALGDHEAARSDYEAALNNARRAPDGRAAWQALIDLGFLSAARDYERAGDYFRRALDVARELGHDDAIAESLNRVGNWYVNVEQPHEGITFHREAPAIFERLGDRRGVASTLDLLAMASAGRGDTRDAWDYGRQAAALFRELDDRQGLSSILATMSLCAGSYEADTVPPAPVALPEAVPYAEESLAIARDIGWRAGESYALAMLAMCLGAAGHYARALEAAQRSLEVAREIDHRQWMTQARCALGALHLDLLAFPAARQHLEEALVLAGEIGSSIFLREASAFLARTCIAMRDLARADALIAEAHGADTAAATHFQRMLACARAELALARGDAAQALDILDRLLPRNPDGDASQPIPRLMKLRGEVLTSMRRHDDAADTLRRARDAALAQGARPLLWRIHLALDNVYRLQRRRPEAEAELSASRAIVNDLAADLPDRALRDQFLQRATALFPRLRPTSTRAAAKQAFGGLTERERDVAALIARGKTNHAIVEDLVLSERTVEAHVANILAKLGRSRRAEIAAWAVQRGLEPQDT